MSATSLNVFFGDAEHRFDFDGALIGELEILTDAGLGALFKRLVDRSFRYADLLAVLRLGLIGGGTRPEEAVRLVKVYGEGRPIEETYPVAVAVLSALWFGNSEEPAPAADPEPEPAFVPVVVSAMEPAPIETPAPIPASAPVAAAQPAPVSAPAPAPLAWEASLPGTMGDIGSEV